MQVFAGSEGGGAETHEGPGVTQGDSVRVVVGLSQQLDEDLVAKFYPVNPTLDQPLDQAQRQVVLYFLSQVFCHLLEVKSSFSTGIVS